MAYRIVKEIKNGVEYYPKENGSGGGGDLDIWAANALIDAKLGNYDSLFSLNTGLYKILNWLSDEDELGLTGGENWDDITDTSASMSLISHSYTVMVYVANSKVAMEEIVSKDGATKEVSECRNSISVIADCELARDIYLNSDFGIKNLFTYQAAQDAFFTDNTVKQQIISDNIMVIVNDNDLLAQLYNDSIVASVIAENSTALSTIAGDDTKLNIVMSNATIMNAIYNNATYVNAISTNSFVMLIEDSTNLSRIIAKTPSLNKLKSANEDTVVLPAVLSYTWLSGYSTFAALAEDDTAMETVRANNNATTIINNNTQASSHFFTSKDFSYTGDMQYFTIPQAGNYLLEVWGAWAAFQGKGGYAKGYKTFAKGDKIAILVGQNGASTSGTTFGFGGSSNYSSNRAGGGLTWIFTGSTAVSASDSARAIIIAWGAGSARANGQWGQGGGETWGTGTGSYGTAWAGGTQTGHGSGGNVWAAQFNGGNGSSTYWYWGGGWRRGGNGSIWDGSGDDDKGGWGGSGYIGGVTNGSMTAWGGVQEGNGKAKITKA